MISRDEILGNLERYNLKDAKIGVVASHSALDTCDGAISEGFRTVAICQRGRDATFSKYFRSQRDAQGNIVRGVVDEPVILDKFSSILNPDVQKSLMDKNVLFVPNSKTEYAGVEFTSMVKQGRLWACQFHPEKSGRVGLELLKGWLAC